MTEIFQNLIKIHKVNENKLKSNNMKIILNQNQTQMKKVIFKDDINKILSANMRNCFQITKNIEENVSRKRNSF